MINLFRRYQGKMICCVLVFLTFSGWVRASDYSTSYAVVVSEKTYADPDWKKVADVLIAKHQAHLVIYPKSVDSSLKALQKIMPKYTCFVAKPEEAGFNYIVTIHRFTRTLDADPYCDTLWGVITGYTPKDALRMAEATQPQVVERALISAGMGAERWKESIFLSTSKAGEVGSWNSKAETMTKKIIAGDLTPFWVKSWNEMDPDALITSAHASQKNLEMPFSRGNILCRDGKLFGYVSTKRLLDSKGQPLKTPVAGTFLKLNEPKKPKLHFAVGNCLIGDIPNKNCMALALMGFGKVNQMIAYTVSTWYGKPAWTTLGYWERTAGDQPLNEAFYFCNANTIHQLEQIDPQLPRLNWPVGHRDLTQQHLRKTLQQNLKKPLSRDILGLCHDRDVIAFYGDPSLEIRLSKEAFLKKQWSISLTEKEGIWTATIHAITPQNEPNKSTPPLGIFFPRRLKQIKLISGVALKPIFADNFLLVTHLGPFKANTDYTITFSANDF